MNAAGGDGPCLTTVKGCRCSIDFTHSMPFFTSRRTEAP